MRVATLRFGERIAPGLACSASLRVFTLESGRLADQVDFWLPSRDMVDHLRLLRDRQIGTLICGDLNNFLSVILQVNGVRIISRVCGVVGERLVRFRCGAQVARTGPIGAAPEAN